VGAGGSGYRPDACARLSFSNYGSRLDVQAWGEDIVTTGGRSEMSYMDLQPLGKNRSYTKSFGGTSGASAMVAGAVGCICGVLLGAGKALPPPSEMRKLLTDTGLQQLVSGGCPVSQSVGPQVNVTNVLKKLGF